MGTADINFPPNAKHNLMITPRMLQLYLGQKQVNYFLLAPLYFCICLIIMRQLFESGFKKALALMPKETWRIRFD
jgi:hypothetical protein